MTKTKFLPIIDCIAYVAMVLVNVLFQMGGRNTASVSDQNVTLLTPSGITFSIWLVIYGLLLIYTIRQAYRGDEYNVGLLYLMSCILNIMWIIVWNYKMLAISLAIIIALGIILYQIKNKTENADMLTKITFSIYCAWITVASIVSIFVLITNLSGTYNSSILRVASVLALVILLLFIYRNKNNVAYLSVFVWSLLGIIIKNVNFFNSQYKEIIITCILMIMTLLATIFISFNNRKEIN